MDIKEIQKEWSQIIPNISKQDSYEMLQPMVEILREISYEFIQEHPTMKKQVTDAFHMVIEITKEKYGYINH